MIYIRYGFSVILSLLLTLLTWVLCIPLALCVKEDGNLPKYLYWFQTFDNTCDAGWQQGYDGYDPNDPLWWNRCKWLARNPGYGFDYWLFGIAWDKNDWSVSKWSSQDAVPNYYSATSKQGYFSWTYSSKHIQLKFGWKSWGLFDRATGQFKDGQFGPEKRQPLCFTIVPRF